jgi:hypothetical protein
VARFPEQQITAGEAVAALRLLEPRLARDLTERRFRYAAEATGAVKPGRQGWTALYGRVDVALVRLLFRLEEQISIPVARFTASYLAADIRGFLETTRPVAAVLVVPVGDEARYPRRVWPRLASKSEIRRRGIGGVHLSLREVMAGIPEVMAAVTRDRPTVRLFQEVERSTAAARIREHVESVGA